MLYSILILIYFRLKKKRKEKTINEMLSGGVFDIHIASNNVFQDQDHDY